MVLTRSQKQSDTGDSSHLGGGGCCATLIRSDVEKALDARLAKMHSEERRPSRAFKVKGRKGWMWVVIDLNSDRAKGDRKTMRPSLKALATRVFGCRYCGGLVEKHGLKIGPEGPLVFTDEVCGFPDAEEENQMRRIGLDFVRTVTIPELKVLLANDCTLGCDECVRGKDRRNPGREYLHYTAAKLEGFGDAGQNNMDQMAIAYLNKGGFELLQNLFMKYTGGFDDPKIKSAVKKKLEVLFKLCTPGSGEYIRGAHELMQAVDWLNDLISRIERPFDKLPLLDRIQLCLDASATGSIGEDSRNEASGALAHFSCLSANDGIANLIQNATSPAALKGLVEKLFHVTGVYQRSTAEKASASKPKAVEKAVKKLETAAANMKVRVMTKRDMIELQRAQDAGEAPTELVKVWVRDPSAASEPEPKSAAGSAFAGVGKRVEAATKPRGGMALKGVDEWSGDSPRERPYSLTELGEHLRAGKEPVYVDAQRETGLWHYVTGLEDRLLRVQVRDSGIVWGFHRPDGWMGKVRGHRMKKVFAVARLRGKGFAHWMVFCEDIDSWLHESARDGVWKSPNGTNVQTLRSDMMSSDASTALKQVWEEAAKSIPTQVERGQTLAVGVGLAINEEDTNCILNGNLKLCIGTPYDFEYEVKHFETDEAEAAKMNTRDEQSKQRRERAREDRAREASAREERAAREASAREERIRRSRERPSLMRVCVCGERVFDRRATFCCKCGTGLPGFTTEQQKELRRQHGDGACAQQ